MAGIPPIEAYPLPTAGALPPVTPHWTVDPDRAVLLVHDMQRYFLAPFPCRCARRSSPTRPCSATVARPTASPSRTPPSPAA